MSRGWAKGSTRRWRRIRAEILLDNALHNDGLCRLAIPEVCTGLANTVHHTKGRAVTGDDRRFLIATCTACNLKTGDPTRSAAVDPPGKAATAW